MKHVQAIICLVTVAAVALGSPKDQVTLDGLIATMSDKTCKRLCLIQ